ncbi:MAG: ABC transporter ATP-binding protein [candidate division Zixibacteria bacterium]
MNPIIEAKSISKQYGDLTAVDNIDFTINEGETFGFLGPNGAGKTTTMKMIYCFIRVSSGTLSVFGMDVAEKPREIKALLGVIPQEDSLDPDLTVYGNLITYSRYYEVPKHEAETRAEALMKMVSLTEKKDVIIEDLSGGMKRRLLIARGLINNPKILILDEPTVGLDPQGRHLIWAKLNELKKSGITIIITTHYMEEASRLCDRLIIMNNGRILDLGSPDELVKKHIGKEVLEIGNIDDDLVEKIFDVLNNTVSYDRYGDKLYLFADSAIELAARLKQLRLDSLLERKADLEDVFLALAGRSLIE